MTIDHKKMRRALQWAFPGVLLEMTEAWDGEEDYQTFLDRCATWKGKPVTAVEVEAKVLDFEAHMADITNPSVISYDAFLARFNDDEQLAVTKIIYTNNPTTGEPLYPNLQKKIAGRESVDLENPKTIAAMGLFVSKGAITEARKTTILTP